MKLSHLSETLVGSEIVKLGNQIKERMRLGEKIYNFTIGDFDSSIFPIPKALENAITKSYEFGYTNYPPAEGILELREAVASFIQWKEGLSYGVSEIQIASGGRPLIYAVFRALVDPGDKVIYAVPSWNNNHYAHFTKAEHIVIQTKEENGFMPTANEIAPALKGATLLCLCTPQNPTGTMFSKAGLEEICKLVLEENLSRGPQEKKLFILFDQMYWTLTYGNYKHYNPVSLFPELREVTIFIDGISKVFAATGVRVGWSFGPVEIIAKVKAVLSHVGAWAPLAEQYATASLLENKEVVEDYLISFKEAISYRLNQISAAFINLKESGFPVDVIQPQGAIYLTLKIDLVGRKKADGAILQKQSDVTQFLLDEAALAIVPFSAFGADKNMPWYRLSVGTCKTEDIPVFIKMLEKSISSLKSL
ncbi:MAG: aminotransferase class I/II-fold pyridoxal phosphate-dependent enzyme [Bacteroidetes bacterium]|nr:aminotransferase class I/II-fold pyridoxal phosphate-dependent enzyme [Bacteroidota bacterium]